jgi:monoamine oxidase
MRIWNVGIVGGGPGGLITAYSLQKLVNCPVHLTLFEASPRLGGKILTPHFRQAPVRYEAGAAEFYDYSLVDDDPLKNLVAELGLLTSPMGGSAVIMNHHILSNLDDIRDQLGPNICRSFQRFDRRAKDLMTPQEYYYSDDPDGTPWRPNRHRFDSFLANVAEPSARHYIETLIHSDLATEPHRTSLMYGLQNYLMNAPAYMQLYSIDGGNERLPQELAARIHATILLQHRVYSIAKASETRLRVISVHQGIQRQDEYDFVVIALPYNHLQSIAFCGARLAEGMRQHQGYYDYPAHYLRITLLFEQPFWRNTFTDSYLMLDRFDGCCLYDESSREPGASYGVLGWLLGGKSAMEMSRMNDEQLIAKAMDSLPHFIGPGHRFFVEGQVHRWIGAVNAIPGGVVPRSLDRRHQPESREHPNLFLVGDYLFDSTLNGVFDSAQYVAAWIAAQMSEKIRTLYDS